MQTTLSRLHSWAFDNKDEDIRGWAVLAPDGQALGTVGEVVVDTVTNHLAAVITADGKKLRAHDLIVGDHMLTMLPEPRRARQAVIVDDVRAESDRLRDVAALRERTPADMAYYNDHFRRYYLGRGYQLEALVPAYAYGEELRRTTGDRDWAAVEVEGRRTWEAKNPGTWERFAAAIRHGWDRVRS